MALSRIHEMGFPVTFPAPHVRGRAWEAAFSLLAEFPDRLTIQQNIECRIALMAGPDEAPLSIIPMACRVIGGRQ